jgi:hypothetical protein
MSHIAIPHLAAVSLVPRRQSVMEGVLTRARTSTRNRSAGDIPRKVPRREILRRFQAKSSVRAEISPRPHRSTR